MPGQSLKFPPDIDHLLRGRILIVGLLQLRLDLQRLIQRHLQLRRHQFGQPVRLGQRHIHHPAHIPHHRAGLHRPKGNDLGDLAVFLPHIIQRRRPRRLADVDINIRHLVSFRVHKPLKQQVVLDRIHIAHAETVSNHRADSTAASTDGNMVLDGIIAEVPADQKIAGKTLTGDDRQFPFDPLLDLVGDLSVFFLRPLIDQPLEKILRRTAVFGMVNRCVLGPQFDLNIASLGDLQCVVTGLRNFGKQLPHLLGAFQINTPRILHPLRVSHFLAGIDAAQRIMGLIVTLVEKMHIIRRNQFDAHFPGQLDHLAHQVRMLIVIVLLNLQEKPIRAEDTQIVPHRLSCALPVIADQGLRNLPANTGRRADQPFVQLRENLFIDPRTMVKSLGIANGAQFQQVMIAGVIFGQQDQMRHIALDAAAFLLLGAAAGRDIRLDAQNRLDPRGPGLRVKVHHTEHVPVVGHRDRIHPQFLAATDQLFRRDRPIQKRVLRM